MADTPHFDLPFRFAGKHVATVEQDSLADVANCVEAILLCPVGFRPEAPSFGSPDFTLRKQPIGRDLIQSTIVSQEPRAQIAVEEAPDLLDNLIDRVSVDLTLRGGASE
jgi:phage baseplate assembly protein W